MSHTACDLRFPAVSSPDHLSGALSLARVIALVTAACVRFCAMHIDGRPRRARTFV